MYFIWQIIGGLGLLLLGLFQVTEGLKLSVGGGLARALRRSTTPPWRGVLTGTIITAVAQSSSAITVATIGFVNAGLMTLGPAVAVIIGTNVGTTTTAWLVSFIGIKLKISAYALPMIGAGILGQFVTKGQVRSGWFVAVAGFGLFFLGLSFLKAGFEGVANQVSIDWFSLSGAGGLYLLAAIGVGFVMTMLAQSSSAAIAIILMAAEGQVISVPVAAAMVIGANIGTTSTALLATLGASAPAKRVAIAHILFNLMTGAAAVLILLTAQPLVAHKLNEWPPAVILALFHTGFNLLGVVIIFPLHGWLINYLNRWFHHSLGSGAKPRHLDKKLISTPALALHALTEEVVRLDGLVSHHLAHCVSAVRENNLMEEATPAIVSSLVQEIYKFAGKVQREPLSDHEVDQLSLLLRISQYYLEASELTDKVAEIGQSRMMVSSYVSSDSFDQFISYLKQIEHKPVAVASDGPPTLDRQMKNKIEKLYHEIRSELLLALKHHDTQPGAINQLLISVSTANRIVARLYKARKNLGQLGDGHDDQADRS